MFLYVIYVYLCVWVILNIVVIYIYNVNIVYSCKLYYVRIICGYDFSFYIFEEISEKKDCYVFLLIW